MPPAIDEEKCIKCGNCARICPMRVFTFSKKEKNFPSVRFGDECWHCLLCELECPRAAITVRIPMPMMLPNIEAGKLHNHHSPE